MNTGDEAYSSFMEAADSHLKADDEHENDYNQEFIREENVECELCSKEVPVSSLRSHILTVHCDKEKVFICSICDSQFYNKRTLQDHVQCIHVGNFKKYCQECNKEVSMMNYKRHIKEKHMQEKKSCPYCDKLLGMSNLRKHIRGVHNKEQHSCPHCSKAFTQVDNLTSHIKRVHMKLKKTCDICNEDIPWSAISIHKRMVHKIGKPMKNETSVSFDQDKYPNLPQKSNTDIRAELYSDLDLEDDIQLQYKEGEVKQITVNGKNFNFLFVEDVDIQNLN